MQTVRQWLEQLGLPQSVEDGPKRCNVAGEVRSLRLASFFPHTPFARAQSTTSACVANHTPSFERACRMISSRIQMRER